ncbi:MAG: hypothetical protein E6895_04095, partial [Klebsiella sp.]|nr:hypothetical protein [Klebsiella sp.]
IFQQSRVCNKLCGNGVFSLHGISRVILGNKSPNKDVDSHHLCDTVLHHLKGNGAHFFKS